MVRCRLTAGIAKGLSFSTATLIQAAQQESFRSRLFDEIGHLTALELCRLLHHGREDAVWQTCHAQRTASLFWAIQACSSTPDW